MRVILLILVFWSVSSFSVAAKELVFGYSLDGRPLSSSEFIQGRATGNVLGYCRALADYLTQQGYQLSLQELNFDQRFVNFAKSLQGQAGVQCGPSSKTRAREAALTNPTDQYTGAFSKPFLVTSTKLLIHADKVDLLYSAPEHLRIGVLKARPGLVPATTELIEAVFPNAQFVGLTHRTEAIQRLTLAAEDNRALDAYATDEIMLYDMLNVDIPPEQRDDYRIEPPLQGYSREEYVLVTYNAPELPELLNTWISSNDSQALVNALLPRTDGLTQLLIWINRSDHLNTARLLLTVCLLICMALIVSWLWRWRKHRRNAQQSLIDPIPTMVNAVSPVLVTPEANPETENSARTDSSLTARETEVLKLLVQGLANKDIARNLDLSPRTVETHRKNIYTKLRIHTPYALVEYAREHGLI